MTIRSRRENVTFKHPFRIRGVDRFLLTGAYEVITDEEMIEGLSFAAFRRIATMIVVPAAARRLAMEMIPRFGRSVGCAADRRLRQISKAGFGSINRNNQSPGGVWHLDGICNRPVRA